MCQLLGLSSSAPIRLSFDWEAFVMQGSQHGGNPDGWGVAYYDGVDAMLMCEAEPAADSLMVQFLDKNAPRSDLIISHIHCCLAFSIAGTRPAALSFAFEPEPALGQKVNRCDMVFKLSLQG